MLFHAGGGHHFKGVQRVAGLRGVNPGVNDAEGCLVKVAADAGKQIGLVWCVDQYLQAFANGGAARAHHRRAGLHVARELFGVPGDVGGVVAHEVAHVQRGP